MNLATTKTLIPYQNWNAVWEANFQPIVVDDFCAIRASFHAPLPDVRFDLVIDPKMAFGTGHHETTYMMIELMQTLDFAHKKVFDFGCGTGILAILAAKLGAAHIDAIDNEQPAYESTLENALINETPAVHALFGTLDAVKTGDYAVILANINRNVLIASMPRLREQLAVGGTILFSGVLAREEHLVRATADAQGFSYLTTRYKGDWIAMQFGG